MGYLEALREVRSRPRMTSSSPASPNRAKVCSSRPLTASFNTLITEVFFRVREAPQYFLNPPRRGCPARGKGVLDNLFDDKRRGLALCRAGMSLRGLHSSTSTSRISVE